MRDHRKYCLAPELAAVIHQGLAVRDRWRAGTISAHGVAVARGQLCTASGPSSIAPAASRVAQRFAEHLSCEGPGHFTFLLDPGIDATNWRAEHVLRPAAVTRNVCGGNRSIRGAQTHEVLASVLRTLQQRQRDAGPSSMTCCDPASPSSRSPSPDDLAQH